MRATVLLADYANLTMTGKLNVMGVFGQIHARQFPCRHLSMYLVVKLDTEPFEDTRGERTLTARLLDPDGSNLKQIEMPFKFSKRSDGNRPEANFVLRIANLDFPRPGDYVWHVLVEDEIVGKFEFSLNQQTTNTG